MGRISYARWLGLAAAAGVAVAFGSQACSVMVQSGRCSKDSDCKHHSENAVCTDGTCVGSVEAADSGVTDGETEAAVVGECKTTEECIAKLGDYSICEKSQLKCVKLLSQDCTKIYGDYKSDNALFIGTMFKQGDAVVDPGASPDAIAAIELAFEEFKNARGGLPNPNGGPSRPLVAVECNQTLDAVRAARHLTDEIHTAAIIGAATSYATIQIATQVSIEKDQFLISPYASSPGLTTLEDKNLVWRTYPSDALQAIAIPSLVKEITASENFTSPRTPGTPIKVGIVLKNDTYGQGLRDIILQELSFNNKSATDNLADGNLKLYDYPNTDDPANASYDFTPLTTQIITEGKPFDILMLLGTSEILSVFSYAESHWPGSAAPPYYIMPDGIASVPKLATTIEYILKGGTTDSKSLRKRIRGTIVNVFSGGIFDSFALRFKGNPINGANAYDAAYVLAYALYGLGADPITGTNLAKSMSKLHAPGTSVDIGVNGIAPVLQALSTGNIVLNGASGTLKFDLASGDVTATSAAVWCLGVDAQGKVRLVTQTGEVFTAADKKMTGTFPDKPDGPDPCSFNK